MVGSEMRLLPVYLTLALIALVPVGHAEPLGKGQSMAEEAWADSFAGIMKKAKRAYGDAQNDLREKDDLCDWLPGIVICGCNGGSGDPSGMIPIWYDTGSRSVSVATGVSDKPGKHDGLFTNYETIVSFDPGGC